MLYLILGVVIFIGIHLVPLFTVRQYFIQSLGQEAYRGLFSLIALGGLTLIIFGKLTAKSIPIYDPHFIAILAPILIMPVVFILILSAYLPSNIKRRTRHPMIWGVLLWSYAHLMINGDLASIILFGSFGAYAAFYLMKKMARDPDDKKQRFSIFQDLAVVVSGILAFSVVLYFHNVLFGVSTFGD